MDRFDKKARLMAVMGRAFLLHGLAENNSLGKKTLQFERGRGIKYNTITA